MSSISIKCPKMKMNGWNLISSVVVFQFVCLVTSEITIKDLKVPKYVKNEDHNSLILDCEYEVKDEKGLEVKWFYNGEIDQIYQWVPNLSRPQALGSFKDIIDTDYKATNDADTQYRALHLKQISPSLSGNYTCKVSGYYDEDVKTKKMVIYEPAKSLSIMYVENPETIICEAYGISPEPNLTIIADYLTGRNESVPDFTEEQYILEKSEDFVYNVTAIYKFMSSSLADSVKFTCILTIPDTDYELVKTYVHYAGIATRSLNPTLWSLMLIGATLLTIK